MSGGKCGVGNKKQAGRQSRDHFHRVVLNVIFRFSDSHSASVKVSPDRVQHFSSESVSLSCEGNFAKWRVMRFTGAGHLSSCSDWGTVNGPTCNIHRLKNKTAVFWCESGSGQFSNAVNITGQSNYMFCYFHNSVTGFNILYLNCIISVVEQGLKQICIKFSSL